MGSSRQAGRSLGLLQYICKTDLTPLSPIHIEGEELVDHQSIPHL